MAAVHLPADHTVISHAVMLVVTLSHISEWYSRPFDHRKELKDWEEYDILCWRK